MKKLLLISVVVLQLIACSKKLPDIPDAANAPAVSAVPAHFVQKVLIENFTDASCGQCPKANLILDSLVKYNSDRVYAASFHITDVMTDLELLQSFSGTIYHDSVFNSTGAYPSGLVNRHNNSIADISPDQWAVNTFTQLSHIPSCGVALEADKINGNNLTLSVHVGFSDNMVGQYMIHAYIVTNSIQSVDSMYDQMNDFSINGLTPDSNLSLYALDDTIHQYTHKNVLTKVSTPAGFEGDPIPASAMVKGNDYLVNYSISLNGINTDNSYIIVFVDKHALTPNGHWIENVQRVKIGETKDWN
jgi:hypothetical protein